MTSKEIAEKYVYGKHNALTDNQEIKDLIEDIENYANNKINNLTISDINDRIINKYLDDKVNEYLNKKL